MLLILCESSIGVTHTGWFKQILIALQDSIIVNMSEVSEQIKEAGVERKEEGTEENPEQEIDPEEADPEEEEYEGEDAIFVEMMDEGKSTRSKPVVKDVFDLKTFEPVLQEGEEYFDDFTEQDKEKYPELFLTDEEVEEIFNKMTESEKKQFLALKDFHLKEYLKEGRITPLSELVQAIMKENKPNIPSTSHEEQEALRDQLLQEARKMAELRERGMAPDIKPPRRIQTNQGPAFSENKDEKGNIVITLIPGRDPYEDLAREDDEVIDITGAESELDMNADMESGDDISIISLDSLAEINKEKVKEVWRGMSEVKGKEAVLYNNLAEMVEDMSPVVIQETIRRTPKPGSNIPSEVESLCEEINNGSMFKKVVAAGYMLYEQYLKSKDKKYKPMSYRQTAKKFQVDLKGLKEISRGAAYERDRKRLERMVKKEELDVKPEVPAPEEEKEAEEPEAEQLKGTKRKHEDTE